MKVFITKNIPEKGIELLKGAGYEVAVGSNGKGAHGVLSLPTDHVDAKFMDSIGPQLKVISNYAVGYDNIDLKEAAKRNMTVTNTPGVLTEAVAEHTVALILAIARRIVEADKFMRSGKYKGFEPDLLLGTELQGGILGIIGCGKIGLEVAKKMYMGFGMQVRYYDKASRQEAENACGATPVSLAHLLHQSDVVSIHLPLLPSTYHFISEKHLRVMKPSAYLINTARGAIVDEKALVKALRQRWIQGAALDVFENEPKLALGLAKLQNVILTPHIASATKEARGKMSEVAAQNIIAVLSGEKPIGLVEE